MKQQIVDMLALQEQINTQVHDQWRDQHFEWYRAIWIESAELLDHYGWKWWKKQTPDLSQVQLELVDIWHFALSMALQQSRDHEAIGHKLADGLSQAAASQDGFAKTLESFVSEVVGRQTFNVERFAQLLSLAELSFDQLYSMYVGKNVLNRFRQDHGYQEGTYQKLWQGREDNEHLAELLEKGRNISLDQGVSFSGWLYDQLQLRYPS